MDFLGWMQLFTKSQDSPALKSAFAAAGVKKIPKLGANSTNVRFDLKGQGLWLIMTDEAYLNNLKDRDIGEGALILSGVSAYLDSSVSRDLYKDRLPYKIAADMSQSAVRKLLGAPSSIKDQFQIDLWSREDAKIIARYTQDLKSLMTFGVLLPRAE